MVAAVLTSELINHAQARSACTRRPRKSGAWNSAGARLGASSGAAAAMRSGSRPVTRLGIYANGRVAVRAKARTAAESRLQKRHSRDSKPTGRRTAGLFARPRPRGQHNLTCHTARHGARSAIGVTYWSRGQRTQLRDLALPMPAGVKGMHQQRRRHHSSYATTCTRGKASRIPTSIYCSAVQRNAADPCDFTSARPAFPMCFRPWLG